MLSEKLFFSKWTYINNINRKYIQMFKLTEFLPYFIKCEYFINVDAHNESVNTFRALHKFSFRNHFLISELPLEKESKSRQ